MPNRVACYRYSFCHWQEKHPVESVRLEWRVVVRGRARARAGSVGRHPCRHRAGGRHRKLHDRIIGKTVRSTASTTRPDPFVKHTGAARRSPLLLLLFNTPLLLLLFNTTRAQGPPSFSPDPQARGPLSHGRRCVADTTCYTQAVNRLKVEGRGEASPLHPIDISHRNSRDLLSTGRSGHISHRNSRPSDRSCVDDGWRRRRRRRRGAG